MRCVGRDVEEGGQFCVGRPEFCAKRTHEPDPLFRELRGVVSFPALDELGVSLEAASTFLLTVLAVRFLRTDEQVVRSDARGVVAAVTDAEPVRDRAHEGSVRKSMCSNASAFDLDVPVAVLVFASGPHPALAAFVDVGPEAFLGASCQANEASVPLHEPVLDLVFEEPRESIRGDLGGVFSRGSVDADDGRDAAGPFSVMLRLNEADRDRV